MIKTIYLNEIKYFICRPALLSFCKIIWGTRNLNSKVLSVNSDTDEVAKAGVKLDLMNRVSKVKKEVSNISVVQW